MINDSSKLKKGQKLKVDLDKLNDRLPKNVLNLLKNEPIGLLVGYKMVDGNQFGLVLQLKSGLNQWFFEDELCEIEDD
ncbi:MULTISPECIES: DUF2862 domain-containing protein [Prochlorococcus]|uniref:DUF2862 domain-containing protein n=1 Tax=Prochlorococcus marinus (strain SARG / CCMP1375 / SS120) TaxID=167539 RepID=Q7VBT8_PROMA|nr:MULTISPECIES: DUF2862 domain-containing protein [Prochlorococcus]AAQ00049.1 Uncharacterized protein Pro_1004 [Prochlorococcus marinus subsp. marinus str. CCMP1375]KGG13846.1 hypothetical protein EV04_0331 [Prochlorococcus marinus str. LG]KGG18979.1 hypothetical protein EV08_1466 [Prochlorococcus marinus str. SS2]KGG23481.1 hypothetical protein EV09_1105 [Prochlorococcus marinus str. SS35]KGG32283.1 hypothetical protein EV10_1398 [Prochlorococcus marinus str. SS51]